jgi:hypothetical protein
LVQHLTLQDEYPGARSAVTFFTISNDKYFPGLVGLLNSLKLMGHNEPVVVGDCGLTAAQRELLAPHCKLFELNSQLVRNPTQYKPFPFLLRPQGTIVLIDSDMIVTRSLGPALALAAQGKICVFPDPDHDTWWAEWQEIFGLPCAPRKQTYVTAGFLAFSASFWPELLERCNRPGRSGRAECAVNERDSGRCPLAFAARRAGPPGPVLRRSFDRCARTHLPIQGATAVDSARHSSAKTLAVPRRLFATAA